MSVLWDLAPHDLSIIDHLIEREPESVMAVGASRTVNGLEDVVHLHLDYGDGPPAALRIGSINGQVAITPKYRTCALNPTRT